MSEKMTVYHGTGRLGKCDFDEFRPDYRGAIWTTPQKEQAEKYAPQNENGVILTCEATLVNPAHFSFSTAENWDIDEIIRIAKQAGCDSAIIDFEFKSYENDYFKFVLENYPDEPAKKIIQYIIGESDSICLDNETISQFAERMAKQNNVANSYIAVFSPEQVKIIDREPVMKEKDNAERLKQISENDELEIRILKDDPDFALCQHDGINVTIDGINREVCSIVLQENGVSQELIDRFHDADYPDFVNTYVDFDADGNIQSVSMNFFITVNQSLDEEYLDLAVPEKLMSEEFKYAVTAGIENETEKSIGELIAEVQSEKNKSDISIER